ncbi:hypothetical protein TNCV_3251821 [Trichonephila clavipes]|nr:hypothetical protein TNCV_3251821 [Trichonephila clavipes]
MEINPKRSPTLFEDRVLNCGPLTVAQWSAASFRIALGAAAATHSPMGRDVSDARAFLEGEQLEKNAAADLQKQMAEPLFRDIMQFRGAGENWRLSSFDSCPIASSCGSGYPVCVD